MRFNHWNQNSQSKNEMSERREELLLDLGYWSQKLGQKSSLFWRPAVKPRSLCYSLEVLVFMSLPWITFMKESPHLPLKWARIAESPRAGRNEKVFLYSVHRVGGFGTLKASLHLLVHRQCQMDDFWAPRPVYKVEKLTPQFQRDIIGRTTVYHWKVHSVLTKDMTSRDRVRSTLSM